MNNSTDLAGGWWITTGDWLPTGRVVKSNGIALGPFENRDLALEVRRMVEREQNRDDLFVGRLDERKLSA